MGSFKTYFVGGSIAIGILGVILIIAFVVNDRKAVCDRPEEMNNATRTCQYAAPNCRQGELNMTVSGKNICEYKPRGLFDNNYIWGMAIFLGIGWIILFIFFLVALAREGDNDLFRSKDFVPPEDAEEAFMKYWSKKYGIMMIDEQPNREVFNFYNAQTPAMVGKEWFLKFQVEIMAGKNPGIYTGVMHLSRGKEWILKGVTRWRETHYDDYRIERQFPLSSTEAIEERMLERIAEDNPEKAVQLQQQMAEKRLMAQSEVQEPEGQQPPPQQLPPPRAAPPRQRSWQRRRYRY